MSDSSVCANCGNEISQNFCPNCGQKKYKRIDGKYIKDEIQYTILHTNKGFFYTLKNLVKNPGKTVKEYIEGNRINHYKPILMAFVMSGISTYVSFKVLKIGKIMEQIPSQMNGNESSQNVIMQNYSAFVQTYSTLIYMAMIPMFAIASYFVFRKQKQNYYEHLVANSYLYVLYIIFCLVFMYLPLYFIMDTNSFFIISGLATLGFILLLPWFFKGLYPDLKYSTLILKSFLFCLISGILYLILIMSGAMIYILYEVSIKGTEIIQPT